MMFQMFNLLTKPKDNDKIKDKAEYEVLKERIE
jgi:hypothetical protein